MASKKILRQVVPVLIGALTGVCFGTMLGWSSVAYPSLVDPINSPILITWDLTALLAGTLMEGNIVGIGFNGIKSFGSKIGVLLGLGCQVIGWTVMLYAEDAIALGVARAFVGFGNGFAMGQLQMYVKETCQPNVQKVVMQYMPLGLNFGVLLVCSVGVFTTFRSLSVVCVFIPAVALILFATIPKNDYTAQTKEGTHASITPKNAQNPADKPEEEQLGFIACLKSKDIRKCMFLSWVLIFVPQYTGGAANIVYAQVVHMAALNPYPEICSIVYSIVFLISTGISLKYTRQFPRKPVIVGSCIICSLLLCSVCFYFYFMTPLLEVSQLFVWSPIILLCIYNFFHTTGINAIPILQIVDIYPKNARVVGSKFYGMYYSLSAVLTTKIFQVMFSNYGMYTAYALLSSVAFGSAIIIACFIKEPSEKSFKSKRKRILEDFQNAYQIHPVPEATYRQIYYNHVDLTDEKCAVGNSGASVDR